MFCEAIRHSAIAERPNERPVAAAKRSAKTLYASLWHCPDCGRRVRVYATLGQVLASSIANDCPDCSGEMEPLAPNAAAAPSAPGAPDSAYAPSALAA